MIRNIAIIVRTKNNPSPDWESEVKGKLGESISPNHQSIEYFEFETFQDLMDQMLEMNLDSLFLLIPLLHLSSLQVITVKQIIDEHNNGENEHFITDIVMVLADIEQFKEASN